jgi:hypothetical protein
LIRLLADSNLREKMSQEGREKAAQFSWKNVSQRVLDFYERSENRRRAKLRLKRMRHNRRITRPYGLGWLLRRRYPTVSPQIPPAYPQEEKGSRFKIGGIKD